MELEEGTESSELTRDAGKRLIPPLIFIFFCFSLLIVKHSAFCVHDDGAEDSDKIVQINKIIK